MSPSLGSTQTPTEPVYDGLVSRYLNRRLSGPIAHLLSHTPVSPNQVSILSLFVAAGALAAFAGGYPVVGGVLAQTSSIIDGVDGDLARLTGKSSAFGGFLDAILDRYADGLILLGLAIWVAGESNNTTTWIIGFAALSGSYIVTYTRARISEAHRTLFDRGITSLASRDVRLFAVFIGAIVGQGLATLIFLAALTNAVVLLRLLSARAVYRAGS